MWEASRLENRPVIQGEKDQSDFTVQSYLLMFVHSAGEGAIQMPRSSLFFT